MTMIDVSVPLAERAAEYYFTGTFLPSIKSSHNAAKRHKGSMCKTGINRDPVYFMDVGAWQGGQDGKPKTTFGLVSGHDALLCSWLGRTPTEQVDRCVDGELKIQIEGRGVCADRSFVAASPISKFFDLLDKHTGADGTKRGVVVRWLRSDSGPFIPDDKLLVVVPDLHLHGYEGPVDRFRYRPTPGSDLVSLDTELRALLDIAAKADGQTVQVGDQYEVWEMELLLRMVYQDALNMSVSTEQTICSIKEGYCSTTGHPAVADTKYVVDSGLVVVDDPSMGRSDRWLDKDRVPNSMDLLSKYGVDFRSTEAIKAAIRRAHPDLFRDREQIFDIEITGNHDNNCRNRYWECIAPDDYKNHPLDKHGFLRSVTKPGTNSLRNFHEHSGIDSYKTDLGNRVWIEHGHYYDWHNNDKHWWIGGHGFDMVTNLLTGTLSGNWGKRSASGGDRILAAVDSVTDYFDYEMRLPELRRFDEIVGSHPEVSLVIMGHTHGPETISSSCRDSLAPSNSGYERFKVGKYYLKSEYDDAWWKKHGESHAAHHNH